MKKTILLLASLINLIFANEIVTMKPFNPLPEFDILAPTNHKAKDFNVTRDFSSHIKNINSVNTIIEADDGFYICGNSLTSDNLNLKFNSEAFAKSIGGFGYYSVNDDEETFSLSSKNIFVSIMHYSKDGKFLWRSDFPNDMLSSSSMVRLENGNLLVALTPVFINEKEPFESYIFIYSKAGKLLGKRKYKNYIINSMIVVSKDKILCGTNKREKVEKKGQAALDIQFKEKALLVDTQGFKIKDIDLRSRSYVDSIYDDLTKITKISTGYLLYGGQEIIKLDNNFKLTKYFYLGPRLDGYSSYSISAVHEDKEKNIHVVGNYGHQPDAVETMKLNRLTRLNNPRSIEGQFNPATQAVNRSTAMSMTYDIVISEQKKYNKKRAHGYTGVYTKDSEFLTLIKKDDYGQGVDFYGSSESNGMLYFEFLEDGNGTRQFLFDNDMKLINSSNTTEPLCEIKCMISGKNLYYISLDEENASLKFNKLEFILK